MPKTIISSTGLGTVSPGSCPASSSLQHGLFDASAKPGGTESATTGVEDGTPVPPTHIRVVCAFGFDFIGGIIVAAEAGATV